MRKKIFLALAFIIAGAYIAPAVMAADAPAKKGKLTNIKGEVTAVDAAGNNIKVKEKDKEVTLNVTDKTQIMEGKAKKSLADLKAGDKVVARVTEEDGKMVARSIHIGMGGGKGAKKGAPSKEEAPKAPEAPPKP